MKRLPLLLALILGWCATLGWARLEVSPLFQDHMVLQRDMELPVWGWADANTTLTVELGGCPMPAQADPSGRWLIRLPAMKAGGPHEMTIKNQEKTLVVRDILIGEVWLASGQSNMELPMTVIRNGEREIAAANDPAIRFINVEKKTAASPQESFNGQWRVCSPQSAGECSATGYFFARKLRQELGVPIGLVSAFWGGTPIQSWMPQSMLASRPELRASAEQAGKPFVVYGDSPKQNEAQHAQWETERRIARQQRRPEPPEPQPFLDPGQPATAFNGLIAPLAPFAVRGVIWYQGETNGGQGILYRTMFPLMINSWRALWNQPHLYFYYVQLASWVVNREWGPDWFWPLVREAQLQTLALPDTAMAVTIDIGDPGDIHPRNKQDVGLRLALPALNHIYNKPQPDSGPLYRSMERRGDQIVLSFDHTDQGLVAAHGGSLKGFTIAGAERRFVLAQVKVKGNKIVVWSDQLKDPVAVRYAWADNPDCNLSNGAGLPASPFRTDDWPEH